MWSLATRMPVCYYYYYYSPAAIVAIILRCCDCGQRWKTDHRHWQPPGCHTTTRHEPTRPASHVQLKRQLLRIYLCQHDVDICANFELAYTAIKQRHVNFVVLNDT